MKPQILIISLSILLASCALTPAPESQIFATLTTDSTKNIVTPPNGSWQIQYTGDINTNLNVDIYNLDLFDTDPADINKLHSRGIFVMCYFSAGSFEDWRPDSKDFPDEFLGNDYEGWPGENGWTFEI